MIHIYHPNKAVKGFACSFWYSDRDGSLYATLIKQSGWDDTNQVGTFKGSLEDPTKKVNIKLSDVEACAILDCIERNRPFSSFHQFDEAPKSIQFVPWMVTPPSDMDGEKLPPTQKGYSFTVVINDKVDTNKKNNFYIGLTFAEARLIREFLIHFLHTSFRKQRSHKEAAATNATNATNATSPAENNSAAKPSNGLLDI